MQPHTSFIPTQNFSLLLVGPPLMGKTNAAMLFPDPYIFDADGKLGNAAARLAPGRKFWYNTMYNYEDGRPVPSHLQWAWAVQCAKAALSDPQPKTRITDSLTALSDALMRHIIYEMRGDPKKLIVGGEQMMTLQYWGPFKQLMTGYIMMMKSTPEIFIMTAHEQVEKDELTGKVEYKPLIPGSIRDMIGGLFTDVWRCEVKQAVVGGAVRPQYIVRTQPTAQIALGNSLGLDAEFVVSWEELSKRLNKGAAPK